MRLPWVSRLKYQAAKRRWAREAKTAIAVADARCEELRAQLKTSELERTDLQLKLLRVGFGVNPFAEMFSQEGPVPQSVMDDTPRSIEEVIAPGLSDDEIQATFVREAQGKCGNDIRAIQRHVERRQAEYYTHRQRQTAVVSAAELAAAQAVARDLDNDIAEGRANAAALSTHYVPAKG